jgi:hypothetical protein
VKARIWREEFGRNQAVPVALLSGVFGVGALRAAYGVAVRGFVTSGLPSFRSTNGASRESSI